MLKHKRLLLATILVAIMTTPLVAALANVIEVATEKTVKVKMAPHRALYDITLRSAKTSSGIADIHGKMYYDLKETCDFWETTHRFVMLYNYIDSPSSQVVSQFTTREAKAGNYFEFEVERVRDGITEDDIAGNTQDPIQLKNGLFPVLFSLPEDITLNIPAKALFPVRHTVEMLNKAAKGKKFVKALVFDGSDTEGAFTASGIILKPISEPERKRIWPKDVDNDLARAPGWRTQMAIFPLSQMDDNVEAEYEIDMNLLVNGVVTDLNVRYPDFAIRQSLEALSPYARPKCAPSDKDKKQKDDQTDS